MLAIERRKKIMEALRQDQRVVVAELSQEFDVTEETIRRDLEKLEKEGLVKKTYGGAVLRGDGITDLPYIVRSKENVQEKKAIAERMAALVTDGDHIMLDASSTDVYVARMLKTKKKLTVITNSVEILLEFSGQKDWTVLSTGGLLRNGSLSLAGHQAEHMLSSYHVDKAVVSCKGIDVKGGVTDSNEQEAYLKRIMLENANQRILVADSSKFGRVSFTQICRLEDIDILICDKEPNPAIKEVILTSGNEIIYPGYNDFLNI